MKARHTCLDGSTVTFDGDLGLRLRSAVHL